MKRMPIFQQILKNLSELWLLKRKRKQRMKKERTSPHLYDVVVKQQPEAVALDDGDVVSPVGTTAVWRQTGGENK